jgi:O-antigen ligase
LKRLYEQNKDGIPEIFKIPLVKIWLAFIAAAIISTVFFSEYPSDSIEVIVKFINYFLFYLLGYQLGQQVGFRNFFKWLYLVMLIPSLAGVVQIFIGSGFQTTGVENRLIGTFAHPNAFAFALVVGLTAGSVLWSTGKSRIEKLLWFMLSGYYLVLLVLTYTRSAWIAAFIVGVIILIKEQKKYLAPLLIMGVLFFAIFPFVSKELNTSYGINLQENSIIQRLQPESEEEAGSLYWRWRTWGETLPAFIKQPILGYGPGTFSYVREDYITYVTDLESLEAHNDYLRLAIEMGAIGLILYLALYSAWLKLAISKMKNENKAYILGSMALVVAIIFTSFSDNVLRNAPVQWMLWSVMGLVVYMLINKK